MGTLARAQNAGLSEEPFGEHWRRENKREKFRIQWSTFFNRGGPNQKGFDVVLMPVSCFLAIKHDHSEPKFFRTVELESPTKVSIDGEEEEETEPRNYWDGIQWPGLPLLADLPVTVVPIGLSKGGLPIGVQVGGSSRVHVSRY